MIKKTLLEAVIGLPYLFAFTASLLVEHPSRILVVVVLVSLFASVCSHFSYWRSQLQHNVKLPIVLLLFAVLTHSLITYWSHDVSNNTIRTLLCLFVMALYFPFNKVSSKHLSVLAVMGTLVMLFNSLYFAVIADNSRFVGYLNAIPYSTIAATLSLLHIYLASTSQKTKVKLTHTLSLILSLAVVVMGQTRGIWLALSVSMLFFIIPFIRQASKKALIVFSIMTVLLVVVATPYLAKRIDRTVAEVELIADGQKTSSIGLRLQFWEAAAKIIPQAPIFGVGNDFLAYHDKLYEEGDISRQLHNYKLAHYHNQYIDYTVRMGIVGLAMLLAFFIVPILTTKHCQREDRKIIQSIVSLYAVAALTDGPFFYTSTYVLYFFVLIALCCIAHQNTKSAALNCRG